MGGEMIGLVGLVGFSCTLDGKMAVREKSINRTKQTNQTNQTHQYRQHNQVTRFYRQGVDLVAMYKRHSLARIQGKLDPDMADSVSLEAVERLQEAFEQLQIEATSDPLF